MVAGGGAGQLLAQVATAQVDIYNEITDSFQVGLFMTSARSLHTATTLLDGRVMFVGGVDVANNPTNSVEFFDPAQGVFVVGPPMGVSANGAHRDALGQRQGPGRGRPQQLGHGHDPGHRPLRKRRPRSSIPSPAPSARGRPVRPMSEERHFPRRDRVGESRRRNPARRWHRCWTAVRTDDRGHDRHLQPDRGFHDPGPQHGQFPCRAERRGPRQ